MADHFVLFFLFGTTRSYRVGFWASFLCFGASLSMLRKMEKAYNIPSESEAVSSAARQKKLRSLLSPRQRLRVWLVELLVMLCENSLFISFVAGMTSGLRKQKMARLQGLMPVSLPR